MTTEGMPEADPADVAEQQQDVNPGGDDAFPIGSDDVPWEADEADVADQRREVPGHDDEDEG